MPLPEPFKTNIETWQHTKMICDKLPESFSEKIYHDPDFVPINKHKTIYDIWQLDTLKAAFKLISLGFQPAVLNLADDFYAGGCVSTGSCAQEESLFRSTTLSKHLNQRSYPIKDNELLYSKNVVVFKGSAEEKYKPLDKIYKVDVITCPGIRHPNLTEDDHMYPEDLARLKIKIENIFQSAYKNNVNSIILGALGCGAWKNNPEDVAQVFKEVIQKYDGLFKYIVFAILPPGMIELFAPNSKTIRKNNYETFKNVLSDIITTSHDDPPQPPI
jgi:uncharacterized protein (TIGR02452 family)